jgi:hypothetical protein
MVNNALVRSVFFGNYFYGLCAVALCIESIVQQSFLLTYFLLYLVFLFAATVVYYTWPYLSATAIIEQNPRSVWYAANRRRVIYSQAILAIVAAGCAIRFFWIYGGDVLRLSLAEWGIVLIFPVVAVLYYGVDSGRLSRFSLRKTGWLKPFVIGFTWAGFVTVYPMVYHGIVRHMAFSFTLIGFLLFLKNFMFIAMLCIMFDIKDYATDHNHRLKTLVVHFGLRKTIFFIIIPLSILGLGTFLTYGILHHFSLVKIALNTIPFLLLIAVAYSMHTRKSIFYYLVLIDGLMLVKAVCGTVAMLYF